MLCLQVTYSQCLGVIGYSVLPLVLIATVLPLVRTMEYLRKALQVSASGSNFTL